MGVIGRGKFFFGPIDRIDETNTFQLKFVGVTGLGGLWALKTFGKSRFVGVKVGWQNIFGSIDRY